MAEDYQKTVVCPLLPTARHGMLRQRTSDQRLPENRGLSPIINQADFDNHKA
jgi:hypothetical protein